MFAPVPLCAFYTLLQINFHYKRFLAFSLELCMHTVLTSVPAILLFCEGSCCQKRKCRWQMSAKIIWTWQGFVQEKVRGEEIVSSLLQEEVCQCRVRELPWHTLAKHSVTAQLDNSWGICETELRAQTKRPKIFSKFHQNL